MSGAWCWSWGNPTQAGSVAEESISSIRTVVAFTGEAKEASRYSEKLIKAQAVGIQSGQAIARGLVSTRRGTRVTGGQMIRKEGLTDWGAGS